ncbi:MAG: hypothetical protein IK099_09540 [Clostridia bacterium]|nr:hypothetical protein [Clostridia bacterium]
MSACIRCGSPDGDECLYVRVETETVTGTSEKRGWKKRTVRETVKGITPYAVCPACAKKAKLRAVLMTIPITLIAVPVMIVLSWFSPKPNRDIRKEMASYPVAVPLIAVIVWLCGLSVYLPRPRALYAAEIVHKEAGMSGKAFLVPLDARCFTRRKGVKPADIMYKTPVKTELAEKLVPLVEGETDGRDLIGQTFVKEEDVKR